MFRETETYFCAFVVHHVCDVIVYVVVQKKKQRLDVMSSLVNVSVRRRTVVNCHSAFIAFYNTCCNVKMLLNILIYGNEAHVGPVHCCYRIFPISFLAV